MSPSRTKRASHPQGSGSNPHYPFSHHLGLSEMSPPNDPYEFDFNHTHNFGLPRNPLSSHKRSLPKELSKIGHVNTSAWGSNPPSRMGSRQSSLSTMPPIKNKSFSMESDNDELEFHEVSTPISPSSVNGMGATFFMETPPPMDDSSNPHLHLPSLNVPKQGTAGFQKSPKRRNGWVVPTNGDCTIRTELQVGAIISEILRTAHDMRMRSEPQLANTVKCEHKSVTFEINVRKSSVASCTLHFEWLSGGSHRQFNDVCSEVLQRVHL